MSTADPNVSAQQAAAARSAPASHASRQTGLARTLWVLVRREMWEHRVLWIAPLVIAAVLVACAIPAHVDLSDLDLAHAPQDPEKTKLVVFAWMQWGLTVPQYLVMVIVLTFYLLDCLYAERRDRSILFWKSMPVSDGATVASKLLVALLIVPLGVYLLAIVTSLLFSAVWFVRIWLGQLPPIVSIWSTVVWLKVEGLMLLGVLLSALWYAPLAAYLLLVSAWARRSVFLWATLPPVFAIVAERVAFGTRFVADLLRYRGWTVWGLLHMRNAVETAGMEGQKRFISLTAVFDSLDLRPFLLNIDLWLGLAVAAAFAFAAARIRRYRDDT